MQWIDSHAHLTMLGNIDEIRTALSRAEEAGVGGVLVPSTNADDLDAVIGTASSLPTRVVAAAGVHPHDGASLDHGLKRRIMGAVERDEVVAVGEIGLDYHYMNSPREDQLKALDWQLDLALDMDLPVVLHNRESWPDMEEALKRRAPVLRGVCHSFTEGPDEALKVVGFGLRVGISGMVTFKAADNIRKMLSVLQPEHLLVETDSPFLAPVPHRGTTNEPAYVVEVGKRIAEELEVDEAGLAETTCKNFRKLFGLSEGWPHIESGRS